ncbi:MFS transporter, AAHS family, 3-hydroxyphenylpropionic acid transporter [Pseudomonas linyingensis]|uniref:MFS transporter, AAHS family, 3-hydroxyphenylpropionic acid transporter n=1 Tax=Pseudomonas linyingensis TaxID=915471 RepID=A0A1H6WSJ9_9PSED|nr:3-(3-hydroxy-phenyl)propionate transporter MhpT [Pseudomonas linyingensis]MCM2318958.1 3-(3-hydroxy-phenyl)propionate transporter MhpT [Pseudomonas sp.]SEJ19949.1 MFS transporter, AAHS family, 3-hydroxyphenylpropionic acid transporter [Pseudomonas linyingensis]
MTKAEKVGGSSYVTIALCFFVAILEGMDLQSVGIAAPGMAAAFALSPSMMGAVFSASILGLLPGALGGGWLADRVGRKLVLIGAVILFGLFSIATAHAWDLNSLLAARFLTGLGLGAALPNLIALSAEAADIRSRGTAVSVMYCGVPLGGALAALVNMAGFSGGWKVVFYVGGIAPLLLVPILWLFLAESSAFRKHQGRQAASPLAARASLWNCLFSNGAAMPTLLLWVSYFFTLMVVYMLLNWLPSLLVGQGFSRPQAGIVQILFNIGGGIGSLLMGLLLDRWRPLGLVALTYAGILAALAGLGMSSSFESMMLAGFAAGFFAIGGQLVLYALAPLFYPTEVRGTGVGSAVAVGRLGAMSGPLVAGQMLAMGTGAAGLLLASAPGIVVAAGAVFYLLGQRRAEAVTA